MRDDLETEIQGLAQDIVRRNIGLGDEVKGLLPPDDLYAFLIINKNAHAIMSALLDIKDNPKRIITRVTSIELDNLFSRRTVNESLIINHYPIR